MQKPVDEHRTGWAQRARDVTVRAAPLLAQGGKAAVRRWLTTSLVLLALVAAGLAWWSRGTPVTTAVAVIGNAAEVVYATGVVEPVHWARVASLQRKRIVEICDCEGKVVRKGEVLARLDDAEERAVKTELDARLARLKEDAERLRRLVEVNAASRTIYEDKLTLVREAEARVAAQADRIADLELKAPIEGVVLRRDGEVGEIAGTTATDVLLWVGQARPLRVVAEVAEEDITKVREEQAVLLRHDGHSGAPLAAKVERITPKGDPANKAFRVYIALADDTPLRIGMSVEANIVVKEVSQALLVPAEAIGQGVVLAIEGGRVKRTAVELGVRGTRLVEVRKGLAAGATVVSPFRANLAQGAHVRPREVTAK